MAETTFDFDDSAAYERAMGRWSRAVAPVFLQWLAPPANARWLDVGCGTGIFAHTLLELCAPASVVGVDAAVAQIAQATGGPAAGRASFEVADARKLPFPEASFDIVASALVLNFIADRTQALAEMRRVARAGGAVAAYVWDFAEELSPSGPLRRAMRRFGVQVPPIPGTDESGLEMLRALFHEAGLDRIETRIIDVCLAYRNFEDFWHAQTPNYAPTTKIIASMAESDRARVKSAVRGELPTAPGGVIEYFARANAIKARVPRSMRGRLPEKRP
jgi:ubiquinone/menaquinone biosynthesis C-methylase UbiE